MTQDEAERAEAEAREELWNYARTDERVRGFGDAIKAYAEAVRRTERLKAEALVVDWQQRWERTKRAYLHLQGISDDDVITAALAAYQEGARS